MIRETKNNVNLAGKITEIAVRRGVTQDGIDYTSGTVFVQTSQEPENIIPVEFFVKMINKDKKASPLYKQVETFLSDVKTISEYSREDATFVEIRGASLGENIYSLDGNSIIRSFKVRSNFYTKKKGVEQNQFQIEGEVLQVTDEIVKDVPTGRVAISLLTVGYGERAGVLDFFANAEFVDFIKSNYLPTSLVTLSGYIEFSEEIREVKEESAFGTIVQEERRTKRGLVATGGSIPTDPLLTDEERATLLAKREAFVVEAKEKAKQPKVIANAATTKTTPSVSTGVSGVEPFNL